MFDSAPQGHFLRGASGVHDQVFQRYISMLEGLIVDKMDRTFFNAINPQGLTGRPPLILIPALSTHGA